MYTDHRLRWQVRSKTLAYKRAVESAKKIIDEAVTTHKCVVSWSTGKDSTAMTHLVHSLAPEVPIIIQFDDCDWPTKRAYAERTAKGQGWMYYAVEPAFSVWEAAISEGVGEVNICAQSHWITRESFIRPLEDKRLELGCDCSFLGLRASESSARKVNVATHGKIYQVKDGSWRALPMANWEAIDVFAYLTVNGVEINPCYFQNRITEPEAIRLSWAIPTPNSITRDGQDHLRLYYPEQYRRLRDAHVF